MNAREYLESVHDSENRIRMKIERVQQLQENLTMISSPMDKEQVSHTKNVDIMSETIAKIIDMQKEIDAQTAELYVRKNKLYSLLDQIPPDNAQLLTERFLNSVSSRKISSQHFVSHRHVNRLLAESLDLLQAVMNKEGI